VEGREATLLKFIGNMIYFYRGSYSTAEVLLV
jgi:hypothetical protein